MKSMLKSMIAFIRNGGKVFSEAARGEYKNISPDVKSMWEDLNTPESGIAIDKRNLRYDRRRISHDVAWAMQSYKALTEE